MIVTSLSALAASVRSTLTWGGSNPDTNTPARARKKSATPGTDTVELSKDLAETLIKALDTDGDGVVTREEFTVGELELLKRASVRFHHLPPAAKAKGIEKRDDRWTGRLEDAFVHVDRNHDGAIDVSELTSALPKAATTSVTPVAVAIRKYTAS
jgi:hypothetical protein